MIYSLPLKNNTYSISSVDINSMWLQLSINIFLQIIDTNFIVMYKYSPTRPTKKIFHQSVSLIIY